MRKTATDRLYQQIADAIVGMIPEDWGRVLLYAQVCEESAIVYFYYYPEGRETPEYSLDIAGKWDVDPAEYDALEKKLFGLFVELRRLFVVQGREPWTNLTMSLDRDGSVGVDYDYSDKESSDGYKDLIIWRYKNLGMRPDGERERDAEIIRNYLSRAQ